MTLRRAHATTHDQASTDQQPDAEMLKIQKVTKCELLRVVRATHRILIRIDKRLIAAELNRHQNASKPLHRSWNAGNANLISAAARQSIRRRTRDDGENRPRLQFQDDPRTRSACHRLKIVVPRKSFAPAI